MSIDPPNVDLKQIFLGIQSQMIVGLTNNRVVLTHPGTKGDASELQWLELLRQYLPSRYTIDKTQVIDYTGGVSDQIDLVIYDRQYSPFLLNSGGPKYIPAESVYAAFEVKQDMSAANIAYAGAKVGSVRRLKRTSARIPYATSRYQQKEPIPIIGGVLTLGSEWNPPFSAPFSRAIADLRPEERLNLGCALQCGGFEVAYSEQGISTKVSGEDVALIFFFLRLLAQLQATGTVAAIDLDAYSGAL